MIKSMTGFGRGEFNNDLYNFKIEIKAVNHRYNDISIKMPRQINYLEDKIKKKIKKEINRGKVDIFIYLDYVNDSSVDVKVDFALAKSYKLVLEQLATELELDDKIKLFNILGLAEVIKIERKDLDEDSAWNCLEKALDLALTDLMYMKRMEGQELRKDILLKLNNINNVLLKVEERSPIVIIEYKEKLKERLNNLLDNEIKLDEERIMTEIIVFADKSNINEEIVRLKSHIKQFGLILEEKESIGRKLDFLVQEMNREINTIGSKANDMIISQKVVEIKSEIEQIREQIQNIE